MPAGIEFLVTFGGIAREDAEKWNDWFKGTSLRCERVTDAPNGDWRFVAWLEGHTANPLELRKQKLLYNAVNKYMNIQNPTATFLVWFMGQPEFGIFTTRNPPKAWKKDQLPKIDNRGQMISAQQEVEFAKRLDDWKKEMQLWVTAPLPPPPPARPSVTVC